MRIITYYGDWNCYCGKINRLWDTCACGQIPPCRDWVRGRCTYQDRCRFCHPPFELPDSLPCPKSPIAKPGVDAIVYKTARDPEASAAASAKHLAYAQFEGGYSEVHHPQVAPPAPPAPPKPSQGQSGSALPPLKPAPWARVTPGRQAPVSPGTSNPASPPGQRPPPPPPPKPADNPPPPPPTHADAFGIREQANVPNTLGGFDLFGSNPLINVLESNSMVEDDIVNSAFASLDLGPMPQTDQPAPPGFFVDQGSFLDMRGQPPMPYEQSPMGGMPSFQPSAQAGMMNSQQNQGFMGMHPIQDQGGDEWNDLQLQLPSDLGEILGADVFHDRPEQQQQQQQQQQQGNVNPAFPSWGTFG